MYTVYIGSTYATGHTIACITFSAFFQYMFTATLFAITVDVIDLFARLFRKLSSAYHSLAITITWGRLFGTNFLTMKFVPILDSIALTAGTILCCSRLQILLQ